MKIIIITACLLVFASSRLLFPPKFDIKLNANDAGVAVETSCESVVASKIGNEGDFTDK
jgi:hypothetical protein